MPDIDYQAVFRAMPGPTAILSQDLTIVDVNEDYLTAVGRNRDEVVGMNIFAAFPHNPDLDEEDGERDLRASFDSVLATGERDKLELMRYDVQTSGGAGGFDERYWAIINAPVLGANGKVELIMNKAEEATHVVRQVIRDKAVSG